jgi:hypothetical protein
MATYYSKHNASGGGVGSFADPFNLQELFDNVDAGDLGLVCNTGTYTPSATIDVDNSSACNAVNYAVIRGANADGSDDGTIATISGSGLGAGDDLFDFNVVSLTIKIEGLRITAATNYNINLNTALNISSIVLNKCRIDSATSHGIYNQEADLSFCLTMIDCEIYGNGGCGIYSVGIGRGGIRADNCNIHDNAADGIQDTCTSNKSSYKGTIFCDNGGHGLSLSNDALGFTIDHCVFFANDGNGIDFGDTVNTGKLVIKNNIFRSNGGYGIDTNGGSAGQFAFCDYNCYSNNTSGAMDISTPGNNNVTSDPKFTSEVNGSEDFTLQSDSPCKNAGFGYNG